MLSSVHNRNFKTKETGERLETASVDNCGAGGWGVKKEPASGYQLEGEPYE